MTDTVNGRTVMVRPWYNVPAIPAETLNQVFGDRTVDSRVELVALIIEYWARSGAKPSLMRVKVLEAVQGRINSGNIFDLISLLAKRGFADEFFDLTRPSVDTDGALRAFLLSSGVPIYTIRQYASWNGIDPKLFLDGFFVGMGESAASIVVDLWQLAKLIVKMQQEQLRTMLLLVTDVEAGMRSLREQVEMMERLFNSMVEQLDPTRLPARVVDTWKQWNRDFEKYLEELDPFSAGRLLGKIAGDLFQLLTGVVAVVQLLRVTARLALRYGPLLIGSVRRVAAEASAVIRELAALMVALGSTVIDGTARVGLGMLRTLFPPRVLRQLVEEGRALLMHNQLSLFPVFEEAHALAFPGVEMRMPFGVIVAEEGRPVLMAAMSEKLPPAGGVASRRGAMAAIDEILGQLDDLFRDPEAPRLPVSKAAAESAAQVLLKQRLNTSLRQVLNEVSYAAFMELSQGGTKKVLPHELGRIIHHRMEGRVAADVARVAPGVAVHPEKTLRTLVKDLSAVDREVQAILKGAERRCNETVAAMLKRRPDVMDIIGIPPKASARSERAIVAYLKKTFGWKPQTAIGDLRSDLILTDTRVKTLINVDYTSSTLADRFEEIWGKVSKDLGGKFSGDWDSLDEAYKKAGKEVPDQVKSGVESLTRHAVRETVIRKVALEEIFGKLWHVSSHEMMYDGLGKLWASVKKTPAGKVPQR
jgi:hypothetical protein